MNERIKELAEQAGGEFYPGFLGSPNFIKFREEDFEKFAELLLKDVLIYLKHEQTLPPDPEHRWNSAVEYYALSAGRLAVLSKIIEHIKHRYEIEQ